MGHERVRELHRENCELDDDDPSICMNGVVSDRHFQWNDLRQLESVHEEYPGAAGLVQAWEYDAAGNLAERRRYELDEDDQPVLAQRDEFRWDGLGRMVESARGPPGEPQILGRYDYDAQGLRIRVRGTTRNADAWYDGLNLLVERTPNLEGATPLMRHHYDPMGLHAQRARHGDPTSPPTTHYAHRDALGSTLLMSRPAMSSDTIAASYRTDPWGRITHESGGAHLNPTVFTGHQHDTETGLIYMRARYYDPTIGRFLSQDPWLGDESNPASLNRYLYAYGNPGVWWDPDGLCSRLIAFNSGNTYDPCAADRQREERRAADAQQAAAVAEARRLECVDELGHPHAVPIQIGNASRCTRQMSPQEREENLFLSDAERAGLAFTRNVAEGTAIGVGVLLSVANPATTAVAGSAYGGYRIGEAVHGQRVTLNDGEFGVEQMSAGERGAAAVEGVATVLSSMAGYGLVSRFRQAPTSRQLTTERISDPQRMLPGGQGERAVQRDPSLSSRGQSTEGGQGASVTVNEIATPHGPAYQSEAVAAQEALSEVRSGATLYRQGSFGVQHTADAQYWALQNPAASQNFASDLGMPGGGARPDWILGGRAHPNAPVITRPAPGLGSNPGGRPEAVVSPGAVRILWFHMPD